MQPSRRKFYQTRKALRRSERSSAPQNNVEIKNKKLFGGQESGSNPHCCEGLFGTWKGVPYDYQNRPQILQIP